MSQFPASYWNLLSLWANVSSRLCTCPNPSCLFCERTLGGIGRLLEPPHSWMRQFVKSRVHPGTSYAVQTRFPKDIAAIIVKMLHGMCRADRIFILNLHVRRHSFLYLL